MSFAGEVLVRGNEMGGLRKGLERRRLGALELAKRVSHRPLNLWLINSHPRTRLQARFTASHRFLAGGRRVTCFECQLRLASPPWEAVWIEWAVSLPQAKLISLAQFHSTNPLPVSRGARKPPGSGRERLVRKKWFCLLRI